MDAKLVVRHFGSIPLTARALGMAVPSIYEWFERGIPMTRQYQIELATNGVLRAERPALRCNVFALPRKK